MAVPRIDVSTEDLRLDRGLVFLYMIQADISVERQKRTGSVMIERFTAFYTSRPFWAGDAIDFDTVNENSQFTEQMSAMVFSYDTNDFRLRICKDGMVMLHVFELEAEFETGDDEKSRQIGDLVSWWGRYLDYLNCLYLLLDSATIEVDRTAYFALSEITNKDGFRVRFEDGKWGGEGIATESIASYYQMGRLASSYRNDLRWDSRILHRRPLKKEVFDTLFATFSVVTRNLSLLKDLAAVAKSIAEYKVGNYATSLVLSWFVCESQLSARWRAFLEASNRELPDGSKRVSSDRHQTLTGRDYPISVVSNLLELSDEIPNETFKHIDAVRGYRNKVVHQAPDFSCGLTHCKEAIELALHLTLKDSGIQVNPNLGFSISM